MPSPPKRLKYRRVLLKLSGEALMGDESYGIDPNVIERIAREIAVLCQEGAEIAIVIGGGNIFRGVFTIYVAPASLRINQSHQDVDKCRLSSTGLANDSNRFSFFYSNI